MTIFRLSEICGYLALPAFSSSVVWNFWIVVKMIFPAGIFSFSLRSSIPSASKTEVGALGYGKPAKLKKFPSCSSRSRLSVIITKVGFSSSGTCYNICT